MSDLMTAGKGWTHGDPSTVRMCTYRLESGTLINTTSERDLGQTRGLPLIE